MRRKKISPDFPVLSSGEVHHVRNKCWPLFFLSCVISCKLSKQLNHGNSAIRICHWVSYRYNFTKYLKYEWNFWDLDFCKALRAFQDKCGYGHENPTRTSHLETQYCPLQLKKKNQKNKLVPNAIAQPVMWNSEFYARCGRLFHECGKNGVCAPVRTCSDSKHLPSG